MRIKQRIRQGMITILISILNCPTIFIHSQTRKQYFKKNVERFVYSFLSGSQHVFKEFDTIIDNLPYSDSERKKARRQFKILYRLTGLEAEEYQTIGGLYNTSFYTKLFCNVSRWRQNIFQYSVNKFPGNEYNRALLDDKAQFNKLFADLIGREWILSKATEEDIAKFIQLKNKVIVKPLGGASGKGIFSLDYNSFVNQGGIKLFSDGDFIIEEILNQKGFLHEVNPSSVNTMRVNTLLDKGEAEALCCFLRTGRQGGITDNLHSGGILWQLDVNNGKIMFGVQADGRIVDKHPDSNIRLSGKELKGFHEAIHICLEAQKRIPEIPQVGWDVVISEDGVYLIEGNSGSGFWNCEKNNNCWRRIKKYLIDNKIKITD